MQIFRTVFNIPPSDYKLSYNTKSLFIGSCFTENIGNRLSELKFNVDVNPFGVLYNPISVKNGLEILIQKKTFKEKDLQYYNEQWFSFYHHSRFSDTDKVECLRKINDRITISSKQLEESELLFITFGTAWIYKYIKSGEIVSNCHKIPEKKFKRILLSTCDIFDEYSVLFKKLIDFNPNLKIVFTLSPVRHLKDGAISNQLSKAILLETIHQFCDFFDNLEYFPAYEIMMDDLRDYRFYEEDMIHPNKIAIKYLWEKFSETYINKSSLNLINEIDKIISAKKHKPFNISTERHKIFVKINLEKILKIEKSNSDINFEEEKKYFEEQLL
ncbi:MAG: GSCFA domain-containing protein [Bacteroidales bacterium]|nr:GSCFA domain-containing protein [Bacteroidales bacterium]